MRYVGRHRTPFSKFESTTVPRATEALQGAPGILEAAMFGRALHVAVLDAATARESLPALLASKGIAVKGIEQVTPSLEDVFRVTSARRGWGAARRVA